jgi:hypothetical protein
MIRISSNCRGHETSSLMATSWKNRVAGPEGMREKQVVINLAFHREFIIFVLIVWFSVIRR